MAKLKIEVRDLKTVRETELMVSRRFRRQLDGLDFDLLRSDLRKMFKDGMSRGAYTVFYFAFSFNVEDVDTDELSQDLQRYILGSLKQRFKGKFDEIESAPESDVFNWRVFTSAYKARREELETFLGGLEELFDREVLSKFNVEIDHTIFLSGAVLHLKRSRREVRPRRGIRKKRKRSRVRLVIYKLKGKKTRQRQRQRRAKKRGMTRRQALNHLKKLMGGKRVKRTRSRYPSKRSRTKKSRRL